MIGQEVILKGKDTRIIWGLCFLFLCGAIFLYVSTQTKETKNASNLIAATATAAAKISNTEGTDTLQECAVYISGAVKHPGLYRYQGNRRVSDAIDAVGGFQKNAAKDTINLARILTDGEQINVPTKKEVKKTSTQKEDSGGNLTDADSESQTHLININTATLEELMTLPGVGESKAKMILDYRTQNGFFQKPEDLMQISGIKEGVYNKIKDSITIS